MDIKKVISKRPELQLIERMSMEEKKSELGLMDVFVEKSKEALLDLSGEKKGREFWHRFLPARFSFAKKSVEDMEENVKNSYYYVFLSLSVFFYDLIDEETGTKETLYKFIPWIINPSPKYLYMSKGVIDLLGENETWDYYLRKIYLRIKKSIPEEEEKRLEESSRHFFNNFFDENLMDRIRQNTSNNSDRSRTKTSSISKKNAQTLAILFLSCLCYNHEKMFCTEETITNIAETIYLNF